MAFANEMKLNRSRRWIHLHNPVVQWSSQSIPEPTSEIALENEIFILRKRMEQLFNQEQSLTSAAIIEISSKLDVKINEYMHELWKSR